MTRKKEHGIANFIALAPKRKTLDTIVKGGMLGTGSQHHSEDKWQSMPKGWTDDSRAQFAKTLTGISSEAKKIATDLAEEAGSQPMPGFVDACMDRIGDHVSDPGAFCASLKDRLTGTTDWRGKGK